MERAAAANVGAAVWGVSWRTPKLHTWFEDSPGR